MIKERSHEVVRNWRKYSGTLAATGALAIAGCGSEKHESTVTVTQATTPTETQAATQSGEAKGATLVFDDLHGGSPIIQVYPGFLKSLSDKKPNGTFNSGDSVTADCKTEGRTVHSDPSVGEENRTSNEWVKIEGTPGETQYATAVYVHEPEALLKQLPEC